MSRITLEPVDLNATPYSGQVDNGTAGTADGQQFVITGNEVIEFTNSGVGSLDVVVLNNGKKAGGSNAVYPRTVTVPAGQTVAAGDFAVAWFQNNDTYCYIDLPGGSESDIATKVIRHKKAE